MRVEGNGEYQQYYQDVELIKMQSEVYLSEQIKKETRNENVGNAPRSTGPYLWAPPTEKQVSFMKILANKHGIIPKSKELMNTVLASEFIQKYVKLPTTKSVSWATKLANDRKIILPQCVLEEQLATSEFIEICLKGTLKDMNTFLEYQEIINKAEDPRSKDP